MSKPNFDEMSVEQLDEYMAHPPAAEPEPEPEPAVEEAPAPEVSPDAPPPEAEPVAEPEEPAAPTEMEVMQAQMAAFEARASHWEQVAGREGGKAGHELQKARREIAELKEQMASRPPDQEFEQVERQAPAPAPLRTDNFALWAIKQAATNAQGQFLAAHPEYKDTMQSLNSYMQETGYDAAQILESSDPAAVERETTRLLTEHYWHVRAAQESARVAELKTKKADSTRRLAESKNKAAISGTGAAGPPKLKPKTFDEMTPGELDDFLQKSTGGVW